MAGNILMLRAKHPQQRKESLAQTTILSSVGKSAAMGALGQGN
jgi:hypothetical protein